MAIDIVARALAVSGKQNLGNYYTKTESDGRYVKSSENLVKAFTIPNGTSTGTLAADVKEKLCNPDGHNYYVYDDTSQMILKYSFNEDDEIIQYKAIYLQNDKAYDITMQILPSNGKWTRSQTVLNGATANPTLTGTEAELTGLKVGGTNYKIPVNKKYVDEGFVAKTTDTHRVYATDSTGKQTTFEYGTTPTAWVFPIYNADAQLSTVAPTEALHAVNKQYFENNAVLRQLEEITDASANTFKMLKSGLYKLTNKATSGFPNNLEEGYYTVTVHHYGESECTIFVQTVNKPDCYFAYIGNFAGVNGFYKIATTSDINNKKAFSVTIYEAGD